MIPINIPADKLKFKITSSAGISNALKDIGEKVVVGIHHREDGRIFIYYKEDN